jgi:antitoxin (DNA-binding transcriptional repressor) of toxin-antitoxin stability system
LNSAAAGGSVVGMEQTIPSGALRRQPGICLARVSRGETFVVLRHGHPIAILRPPKDHEVCERRSATLLWRNIRDLLAEGRRKAVLITWYGEGSAVLEPLPADWQWGAES